MAVRALSEFAEQVARLQVVGGSENASNHGVQQSPTSIVARINIAHRNL
jgi:hypothetical protein